MKPDISKCFYRVSIKALILDETKKKFLIGLEENQKWALLGGGLDWGENVEQCLTRELKEEAGLEPISINPIPAYFITGQREDGKWAINLVHEVIVKSLDFAPTAECSKITFV